MKTEGEWPNSQRQIRDQIFILTDISSYSSLSKEEEGSSVFYYYTCKIDLLSASLHPVQGWKRREDRDHRVDKEPNRITIVSRVRTTKKKWVSPAFPNHREKIARISRNPSPWEKWLLKFDNNKDLDIQLKASTQSCKKHTTSCTSCTCMDKIYSSPDCLHQRFFFNLSAKYLQWIEYSLAKFCSQ